MVFIFTFDDDSHSTLNTPTGGFIIAFRIIVCLPIGFSLLTVLITLGVAEHMWRESLAGYRLAQERKVANDPKEP